MDKKGYEVVQFSADWCMPCKMVKPILRDLEHRRGDFKWVVIDVESNIDLAKEHMVRSIPTIILFKDGNKVSKFNGTPSGNVLNIWLDSNIK